MRKAAKLLAIVLLVILLFAEAAPLCSAPYNYEDLQDEHEHWTEREMEAGPAQARKERAEEGSFILWMGLLFWGWVFGRGIMKSIRETRGKSERYP